MENWQQTLLQQYQNAPALTSLLGNLNAALDTSENIESFYTDIMDVLTATGYGLDVWGIIVGVGRVLQVPGSATYFGFQEATGWLGWNQAPWYSGQTLTGNYTLTDDAYRQLILAKAAANLWDGSTQGLNAILMTLYGESGDCYAAVGDLTLAYTFTFTPTPVQLAIIENGGVLPSPSGVAVSVSYP